MWLKLFFPSVTSEIHNKNAYNGGVKQLTGQEKIAPFSHEPFFSRAPTRLNRKALSCNDDVKWATRFGSGQIKRRQKIGKRHPPKSCVSALTMPLFSKVSTPSLRSINSKLVYYIRTHCYSVILALSPDLN